MGQSDYLGNTILDGLFSLASEGLVEVRMTGNYPTPFPAEEAILKDEAFITYAKTADVIILIWGKRSTNFALAEKINAWKKTVFIDGSEFGKNNRYDFDVQRKVLEGTYKEIGAIDQEMLKKCALYFRREKPYPKGVIPLPFGIERRYVANYSSVVSKDIDFVCIFGQDEYPIMRRYAKEMLADFCAKNGFRFVTDRTKGFNFDDKTKIAGRQEFYELLNRAKVGISIGGGGFDTARFWEILGNNCLLLTEKIDIYELASEALNYSRIWQFNNLFDFESQLNRLAAFLRTTYQQASLTDEYERILREHSSKSRVLSLLAHAKEAGITQ